MKKRGSVLLLAVVLVIGLAACGGGNAVPDFDDWVTYQLGHMTVHIPTDQVQEETIVEDGLEVTTVDSTVNGASVVAMQMSDIAQFLRELGAQEADMTNALHGSLHGGVQGFLAEAGGEVRGETQGELNGVRYFALHGVTDLNDAYFESRAFMYGDNFYIVKIFWNDASADIVEPFFQSVRFGL